MKRFLFGVVFAQIIIAAFVTAYPPPESPPPHLAAAFAEVNRGRAALRLPPFRWSNKLAAAAQEHTDRWWAAYTAHPQSFCNLWSHHDLAGRVRRHGWRGPYSEFGIGGATLPGPGQLPDRDGWYHPPRDPWAVWRERVAMVLDPRTDPNDGHTRDFKSDFTHIGIGHTGGMDALVYGK